MSDLPTLIVPDTVPVLHPDIDTHTVRVDGPLPTVWEYGDGVTSSIFTGGHRPLRVGDRVELATMEQLPDTPHHPFPFATATVAEITKYRVGDLPWPNWTNVTVTGVEALP